MVTIEKVHASGLSGAELSKYIDEHPSEFDGVICTDLVSLKRYLFLFEYGISMCVGLSDKFDIDFVEPVEICLSGAMVYDAVEVGLDAYKLFSRYKKEQDIKKGS